ncbi:MAG: tyrosine-type recombinase/integrase, partial [Chloroflexota bacterium]
MDLIYEVKDPAQRDERAVELFLANLNCEGTRRVYSREVRLFQNLVQKPLAQVELEDILRFKESLHSLKPATVARKLVIIKALLTFAHDQRFIVSNPARLIKVPRVHQQPLEILSIEEAEALLRSPDRRTLQGKRDHAVLALLLATGLREAELCALDLGDINQKWSHRVLTVRKGKGGKPRFMNLPERVWTALEAYLEVRGRVEAGPLFLTLGKRGISPARITPRAVDHLVKVHAKRALITKKVTTHILRHCALSFALAAGATPAEVRELAGHSSLTVTNRYVHTVHG